MIDFFYICTVFYKSSQKNYSDFYFKPLALSG